MLLAKKLEIFFMQLDMMTTNWEDMTPIARRMYAMGFMNGMHQIVTQLSEINEQLGTSLGFEDACLSTSLFEEKGLKLGKLLDERMYREEESKDADINEMVDFFPLEKETYTFTSEKADVFKTGMRYLCSENNITSRDVVYALKHGVDEVVKFIFSIRNKKKNIKDFQYEDFWYDFALRDDDLWTEEAIYNYEKWKEEHNTNDIQVLRDKRSQEIFMLLRSGIFSHDVTPTKREIENSLIKIPDVALEDGTEMPENICTECARMSRYVTMKDDILCLDYEKLGKYIYKHFSKISDEEGDSLIYFDNMLIHIHEDIAACNPKLKKYLRFYEDEKLDDVLKDAQEIIDSCKECLLDNVSKDFLTVYMKEAFYGAAKIEVQKKLQGQSKYTLICQMVGLLNTTQRVFRLDIVSADLAEALSKVVKKPAQKSLEKYINQGRIMQNGKLLDFTKDYVTDKLGNEYERLFVKVAHQ